MQRVQLLDLSWGRSHQSADGNLSWGRSHQSADGNLCWGRSHQSADGNNGHTAFAGLNCRKYLHSYYLTKAVRTSWIPPRVLSISSELSASSPLLLATSATVLTYGAFFRPREEPKFGKHPTRVLTDKDEDPKHHRLKEESQHINSVDWPGELLQLSGLLKI